MKPYAILAMLAAFLLVSTARAEEPTQGSKTMPSHPGGMHSAMGMAMDTPPDTRESVEFPAHLKAHELANMRDHLLTIQRIQAALGRGEFNKAAELAEQRLGMSSFQLHGAATVAPHMPKGMQDAGMAMHRAASRFALAATDAGVTGDFKPVLVALAQVTTQCVACHAAFKLK
ncbi:MAG: hypothetical protein OEW39_02475 [Deltaproteobacteria bacterium]|nr:hypothetical protein [Deltaproteobacteria bacterium]